MTTKFLESLTTVFAVCKNRTYFMSISRLSCMQDKCRYYCGKNENNSPDSSNSEKKIKQLLNASSPLRLSAALDLDNDLWATSPYPEGTVFRDTEKEKDFSEKDQTTPSSSVIMFPGQGNQFVGMAKNLMKYPVVVNMFNAASEILNFDLLKICLEGPEDKLNDTMYCQPATFVCSLGLLEKIKEERPWAISNCWATCGYSLGELTALVFAGCVNFETGVRLVKCRAKAMARCCEKTPGGMLTIFVGPRTTLGKAFSDALEHCRSEGISDPECVVASYLFPNCKVIAGNIEALKFIENNAKNYQIRRHSRLPVSGAFHTSLMREAAAVFSEKLKEVELKKPIIKVFSNVTGKPYRSEKNILELLPRQIYRPVRWEQTVHNLCTKSNDKPYSFIYECGPGKSLTATVQKVNNDAARHCFAIQL